MAGWLAGWLADEIQVNFKIRYNSLHFSLFLTKVQGYYNSTNAFKLAKSCCKVVLEV